MPLSRRLLFIGILNLLWASGCNTRTYSIKTETVEADSLEQIVPLTPDVKPLLYTHVAGLARLPVPEAKEKFVAAVLPAILVAKHETEKLKIKVDRLATKRRWRKADSAFYNETRARFKADSLEDLVRRIGTLPNSIILAQAAVESGWGKSRFFLEANNLFGVWSFNADEPRIAAGVSRRDRTVYIRAYGNISESILHYFVVLGSANAYADLREARLTETSPFALLKHLENYSERRSAYTELLKEMILQNSFTRYDQYKIDPEYLVRD
jgi:Bax protein